MPVALDPGEWQTLPDHLWLDGWARWDSGWYYTVFEYGYSYTPGERSNVNFFPLYPWLAGLLSWPLRGAIGAPKSFTLAALVLTHGAAWLALVGLHGLARDRLGRAAADRTVWLLCLFPFSFYLAAAYTEALFLALAIWAFRLADRERWWAACALAALAAITRVPGFLVAVGLACEYLRRRGADPRGWGREAGAFLVTPVPLLILMASFAVRFGDPLVFVTTQRESWGHHFGIDLPEHWALLTSGTLSWPGWSVTAWRVALLPSIPFAVWLVWRWLGGPLALYTALALGLPVLSGIQALERYGLAAFPVFAALGAALHRRAPFLATLAFFLPWLVCFTVWFVRWEDVVALAR